MTRNKSKPNDVLNIDRNTVFCNFAGRITKLLASPKGQSDPYLQAVLDDLLGAVYALVYANHNDPPFEDRTNRPTDSRAVLTRAKQVAEGRVRRGGKWMGGFHFNSALFRIAAVYHRTLKLVTGNTENEIYKGPLLRALKPVYKTWTNHEWRHRKLDKVYDEVNGLKHRTEGIRKRRKVRAKEAISAVKQLLVLLEAWDSHS